MRGGNTQADPTGIVHHMGFVQRLELVKVQEKDLGWDIGGIIMDCLTLKLCFTEYGGGPDCGS